MPRVISTHALAVLLASILLVTATANAQTTWYVDDDAPNDPGPGDPTVSDPLEDGSTPIRSWCSMAPTPEMAIATSILVVG